MTHKQLAAIVAQAAHLDAEGVPQGDWEELIYDILRDTPYKPSAINIGRGVRVYLDAKKEFLEHEAKILNLPKTWAAKQGSKPQHDEYSQRYGYEPLGNCYNCGKPVYNDKNHRFISAGPVHVACPGQP